MQFKLLSVLLLSATVLASPEPAQKRDIIDDIESKAGEIVTNALDLGKSLTALLPDVTSIIPAEILSSITNTKLASEFGSSLSSSLNEHKTPEWYAELPPLVQSYINNEVAHYTGHDHDEDHPSATATPGASGTQTGNTPTNSPNAGAHIGGAIVASVAGAAGVLGLAIML
ncbi:hypothetical protein FQN57_000438 [Myotisia sp. PD_48]|nr:hypothetical protein FQN57_000438 [Myotisia sp. PD_48]